MDLRTEREQHRKEENKKFILKVAEKVFVQKGFSLTTMDEIAKEAQFSKATLYHISKARVRCFSRSFINLLKKCSRR